MPTPQDKQRTRAFRAWLTSIDGDLDHAQAITGINRRTIERMRDGTRPPPVRLFDELATDAARRGHEALAGELAGAAAPIGTPHA